MPRAATPARRRGARLGAGAAARLAAGHGGHGRRRSRLQAVAARPAPARRVLGGTSLTDSGLHADRLDRRVRARLRERSPVGFAPGARRRRAEAARWTRRPSFGRAAGARQPARRSSARLRLRRGAPRRPASSLWSRRMAMCALDQTRACARRAAAGAAAQHHRHDVAVAAPHRGHEVEAGGAGVAGLDAVDAFDPAEQPVVVADGAAAIGEARQSRNTGSSAGSAPGWRCRAAPGRAPW